MCSEPQRRKALSSIALGTTMLHKNNSHPSIQAHVGDTLAVA